MLRTRNQAPVPPAAMPSAAGPAAPGPGPAGVGWKEVPASYAADGKAAAEGWGTTADWTAGSPAMGLVTAGPLTAGPLTAGAMGDAGRLAFRRAASSAVGTMIQSHA